MIMTAKNINNVHKTGKKTGTDMGNPENMEGNAGERPPFPLQPIQNKQADCK